MSATDPVPAVPAVVANKARVAGAEDWLASLPDLVAGLAARWSIEVGATFADATEAYVAAATRSDGTQVVLKVPVPRAEEVPPARDERTVLRLAGGSGCVALLADDEETGAMLLERVSTGLCCLEVGLRPEGDQMLAAADAVASLG